MNFKTPLSVFIIWHPEYIHGEAIGNYLYSALCRDCSKPLIRTLGIPVYYRNTNEIGCKRPCKINFEESESVAIIPLISNEFLLDNDYKAYLEELEEMCKKDKSKTRLYPVSLCKNAYNVTPKISALNFIRCDNFKQDEPNGIKEIHNYIKGCILHELCRLLMNERRATEERDSLDSSPPIKLFISHSKHDDSKIEAIKFRDYINSVTQLKTFFDANDIAYGSDFGEQIKTSATESALVVFQSDSYSDREWCRIEVLEAKSAGCPAVIVNAVQNGEKRTFPYLGNYPSIRLKDNFQDIIDLTLEQVLFNLFTRRSLNFLTDLYDIKGSVNLSTAPELFNFLQLKQRGLKDDEKYILVLYPDPPLGSEEMKILNTLNDDFIFITPIMLPSISKK